MATNAVARIPFSGSTVGRGILVAATATAGTTIHATGTSATVVDVVTLYAVNSSTTAVKLTIEFGGTTSPNDTIEVTVPGESGLMTVLPGLALLGTGSASTIRAFAGTASVLVVFGYVDRVTP